MRILTPIFLALSIVATPSFAQNQKSAYEKDGPAIPVGKAFPPELMEGLSRMREAALKDDYAYQQVAHLTENIGPRPAGSGQAEQAAEYVGEQMRKLGLEVRLEEVMVPRWVRGAESAELLEFPGQAPGTTQKIVLTALGGNSPTPAGGITASVVAVRDFDELRSLGRERVAGKIVLFNEPFDKRKTGSGFALDAYGEAVQYRGSGARAAASLGAVASLIRSVGGADYRLPHTGWSQPAGIPAGAVTAEDADLIAHLAAQGNVRMHLVLTSQNMPDVLSHNVVADLKGYEHPEQIVIVSGHLDSWDLGTGAIDDAAGVAVAMETVQLLQTLHLRPKRTIRVVAWMDEENGGTGHLAYARAHASEFPNHVAAIESDLGADHPLGFSAKMSAEAIAELEPVQTILHTFGANLIQRTNDSPGADITPLADAGVPTLGILQDGRAYFNYHHSAADTLDKIDPQQLRENAAAMAVMGYALAAMDRALSR